MNHSLGRKKKKPTVSDQLKKKSRDMQSVGQKKKKHRKMLLSYKYKKCLILGRAK